MNIASRMSLLLYVLTYMFAFNAQASTPRHDKEIKETKKEIIIVNIDDQLDKQITSLADYTYNVYKSHQRGVVTITTYLQDHDENVEVNELIYLLNELGVEKDHLVVKEDLLKSDHSYFTLSIEAGPKVQ